MVAKVAASVVTSTVTFLGAVPSIRSSFEFVVVGSAVKVGVPNLKVVADLVTKVTISPQRIRSATINNTDATVESFIFGCCEDENGVGGDTGASGFSGSLCVLGGAGNVGMKFTIKLLLVVIV